MNSELGNGLFVGDVVQSTTNGAKNRGFGLHNRLKQWSLVLKGLCHKFKTRKW